MGLLAENKTKRKIGHDPNNTKWTRDTTTFGQKILRSQGWEPGQYLGAKDAAHSEFHTVANASYIRVALKDDMKGLGFNKAKEDEVTGLDVFSDLLSRLNGKSEAEVEQEQQSRLVVKTNHYVEMKWGPMRFVKGGLLVGDTIQEDKSTNDSTDGESNGKRGDREGNSDSQDSAPSSKPSKKNKSKKRKAESLDDSSLEASSDEDEKKMAKRRRKEEKKAKKLEKKLARAATGKSSEPEKEEEVSIAKEKKSKRDKKEKKEKKEKKDKTDRKEKKEKKEKKKRKEASEAEDAEMPDVALQASASTSAPTTGQSTPAISGTSTPINHRNYVRSRFIASKRQAMLDTKALNQIFMVKA